jgi:hypothetical protein
MFPSKAIAPRPDSRVRMIFLIKAPASLPAVDVLRPAALLCSMASPSRTTAAQMTARESWEVFGKRYLDRRVPCRAAKRFQSLPCCDLMEKGSESGVDGFHQDRFWS